MGEKKTMRNRVPQLKFLISNFLIFSMICFSAAGCSKIKNPTTTHLESVVIENNELKINGANLSGVNKVELRGPSGVHELKIHRNNFNQVVARGLENLQLVLGVPYEIFISNASAQNSVSSYSISFSLPDASVEGKHIKGQTITVDKIDATGTRNHNSFLRGDGTWSVPGSGGSGPSSGSDCPEGTVALNDRVCIETAVREAASPQEAPSTCIANNGRFCQADEWVYACANREDLGLGEIHNSVEFLGSLTVMSNSNWARFVTTAGNGWCRDFISRSPADSARAFRCCYDR
jgi:hypothetical protein